MHMRYLTITNTKPWQPFSVLSATLLIENDQGSWTVPVTSSDALRVHANIRPVGAV